MQIPPPPGLPGEFVLISIIDKLAPIMAIAIITIGVLAFYAIRSRNRRVAAPVESLALRPIEERLGRLEQSVEAIGVEVERLAEGQRFVTKMLTDAPRGPAQLRAGQ